MKMLNCSFGWKTLLAISLMALALIGFGVYIVIDSGWLALLFVYGGVILVALFSILIGWLIATDNKRG